MDITWMWWQETMKRWRRDFLDSFFSGDSEEIEDDVEKFSKEWFELNDLSVPMNCAGYNGLNFHGHYVPEEMLCLILRHVGINNLLNCRLVCHQWKSIVDLQITKKVKLRKRVIKALQAFDKNSQIPFSVVYTIHKKKPFNRNFIKNSCGEEGLNHWKIKENGGDHWIVEKPPCGSFPLEGGSNCCFVTSFGICCKEQLVDLRKEGVLPIIMDELQPKIYVSEMYASRFDCASTYALDVALLDKTYEELDKFRFRKSGQGDPWHKVEHSFENCKGVRFVRFTHAGKDDQFWKGHYGSKMSEACVMVLI